MSLGIHTLNTHPNLVAHRFYKSTKTMRPNSPQNLLRNSQRNIDNELDTTFPDSQITN